MAEARLDHSWRLDAQSADALGRGAHSNPFAVLGPHDTPEGRVIRAFLPGAVEGRGRYAAPTAPSFRAWSPASESGLFENLVAERAPYRLRIAWPDAVQETEDPYSFGLLLGDVDLHLFNEGRHFELARCLGAQRMTIDGVNGVRFAVWAPNAERVAVVGDFNSWDRRRHPMRMRHSAGIWELFVPRVAPGSRYKYDILGPGGVQLPWKADPVARQTETPPSTASVVPQSGDHRWRDDAWLSTRRQRQAPEAPIVDLRGPSRLLAETG